MSQFWNSADEYAKAVVGMLDKAFQVPVIRAKEKELRNLLVFSYHDPEVTVWIDSRGEKTKWGAGPLPGEPDVVMSLCADDGHRSWSNKFNVILGIARRKIKVTGDATKVLKLTPLLRKFAIAYNDTLREMGREDIIL